MGRSERRGGRGCDDSTFGHCGRQRHAPGRPARQSERRLAGARGAAPLRFLTPSNHGDAAWVFTSTYGGGLLGGDAVRLQIDARRRGGSSSSRRRRRRRSIAPTRRVVHSRRARRGTCTAPGAAGSHRVCFRGASFEQTQSVDDRRSGSIVLMDWMTAGRRASGERWVFDRYASRLTIRYDGRVVFHDALLLSPSEGPLAERMGRFDCVCLIVLVGVALRVHAASACNGHALGSIETQQACRPPDGGGSARPERRGRLRDSHGRRIGGRSRTRGAHVVAFRPGLLGDDPRARKW